jgi:peptidyl-prolyl cis-trans isomerase SurA
MINHKMFFMHMSQSVRRWCGLKGVLASIAFVCSVSALQAQPYVVDQVAGVVGTSSVKLSDIETQYMQQMMQQQGVALDPNIRCLIFERMMEQKLLANQAAIDSIVVSNSDVQRAIDNRLRMLLQNYGSEEQIVRLSGRSILQLREDWFPGIREQLLAEQMQSTVIKDVKVAPVDVRNFYNQLPKDSIPEIGEQVEWAQILMNAPYKDEAIALTRQELLRFRERILNGESFRTLAILYSEEPAATQTGGELDFISRAQEGLDPDFARAAFTLKKPGDVSRVIESKFGLHIIQLIEKRGDQVKVRHIIRKPKIEAESVTKVLLRLDSIADMIRRDSFSFADGARYLSHDENTRMNGGVMVHPGTGGTRFELTELIGDDQRVLSELREGEISKAYQTVDERGNAVFKIVKLQKKWPAHRANLSQDYEYLLQLTTLKKRQEHYSAWLREKIKNTYIRINEPFSGCTFSESAWLK